MPGPNEKLEGQLKDNFPDDSSEKVQNLNLFGFRLNKKINKMKADIFSIKNVTAFVGSA